MIKVIKYEKPKIDPFAEKNRGFGKNCIPYTDNYYGKFVVEAKEDVVRLYAYISTLFSHKDIVRYMVEEDGCLGLILGGGKIKISTTEKEVTLDDFSGSYGNVPISILNGAFKLEALQSSIGLDLTDWKLKLLTGDHKYKGDDQKFDESWFKIEEWCTEHGISVL